jgi:AAA ATPase domain
MNEPQPFKVQDQILQRLATRATFDIIEDTKELESSQVQHLLSYSDPLQGTERELKPAVRKAVLKNMSQVQINENLPEASGLTQSVFNQFLRNEAPELAKQSARELTATQLVLGWLPGEHPLPEHELAQHFFALADLKQSLAKVSGGAHFRGRHSYLDRLTQYVADTESSSRSMMIFGPGGVGKSALVAHFLLNQHSSIGECPFGYLDLDRPGLNPLKPSSLLAELARQLSYQYLEQRGSIERLLHSIRDSDEGYEELASWRISEFATIVESLAPQSPYVIVLDTFEEVQFLGQAATHSVLGFVQTLQEYLPGSRIIIAGRAELESTERFPMELTLLDDFDEEAAHGYLEANGVAEERLRTQIISYAGKSPLSLRLAVDVVQGEPNWFKPNMWTRLKWTFSAQSVQGELYARVLAHIENQDVRKLAHPGLVLRRITPEIIKEVLAKPCGVSIPDLETAKRLFDELRREVSLVRPTGEPDVLLHRSDVRRVVHAKLKSDKPHLANEIERTAVEYYTRLENPTTAELIEEVYHRLSTGMELRPMVNTTDERVDEVFLGLRQMLADEDTLSKGARATLAKQLGESVSPDENDSFSESLQEDLIERDVRQYMKSGHFNDALALIDRIGKLRADSPLMEQKAECLWELGKDGEAHVLLGDAENASFESGDRSGTFRLAIRRLRVLARMGHRSVALEELKAIPPPSEAQLIVLQELNVAELEDGVAKRPSRRFDEAWQELVSKGLQDYPLESVWAVSLYGIDREDILKRTLENIAKSVFSYPRTNRYTLLHALKEWNPHIDQSLVLRSNDDLKLPKLLLRTDPTSDNSCCKEKPTEALHVEAIRKGVVEIYSDYLRGHSTGLMGTLTTPKAPYLPVQGEPRLKSFESILSAVFPNPERFREFSEVRLSGRLTSGLIGSEEKWESGVAKAARRLHLQSATLVAALESFPTNPHLYHAVTELGYGSFAGELQDGWSERLGLLESCCCRVHLSNQEGAGAFVSGFLFSPELILTSCKALRSGRPERVVFDKRPGVTSGTSVEFARVWRRDDSPTQGYALLQLDRPVGLEPIRPIYAESNAATRFTVDQWDWSRGKLGEAFALYFSPEGLRLTKLSRIEGQPHLFDLPERNLSSCEGGLCLAEDLTPVGVVFRENDHLSVTRLNEVRRMASERAIDADPEELDSAVLAILAAAAAAKFVSGSKAVHPAQVAYALEAMGIRIERPIQLRTSLLRLLESGVAELCSYESGNEAPEGWLDFYRLKDKESEFIES